MESSRDGRSIPKARDDPRQRPEVAETSPAPWTPPRRGRGRESSLDPVVGLDGMVQGWDWGVGLSPSRVNIVTP